MFYADINTFFSRIYQKKKKNRKAKLIKWCVETFGTGRWMGYVCVYIM